MSSFAVTLFNVKKGKWETVSSNERTINGKITITPEMAREFLKRNKNRDICKSHIADLARDMVSGNWDLGFDAIAFDNFMNLLNGQHRLLAIIKSNTAQEFNVIWGATKKDQKVGDQNKSRGLYDIARLDGVKIARFPVSVGRFLRRQTIINIPRRATRVEEVDFLVKHKKGLEWAGKTFRPENIKKDEKTALVGVGNDVASAFTRAYLHYEGDVSKQQRVELMAKGLVWQDVYDKLISKRKGADGAFYSLICKLNSDQGQKGRDKRYRVAEKAILLFVNGDNCRLKISGDELFPLKIEIATKNECCDCE